MNYLPFVAHFFSPALRLAPLPLRSGLLRISANLSASVSLRGTSGCFGIGGGSTVSPSAAGKSWMDQLLLINFL